MHHRLVGDWAIGNRLLVGKMVVKAKVVGYCEAGHVVGKRIIKMQKSQFFCIYHTREIVW